MMNKLSEKTKRKSLLRWMLTSCNSMNYEKLLSLGYCYAMLPVLREIYKDKPDDLKKSVKTHLQFFNCTPWVSPYIQGLNTQIEEAEGANSLETVASLKTALMAPLSALGDTMMVSIPWTIFGAIASYMALEGNPFGILLWIVVSLLFLWLSFPLYKAGYKSGMNLLETLQERMGVITKAISTVGLMVVGALIPTVIKADIKLEYNIGEVSLKGQEILDQIMPNLFPAAIAFLVYYLLGKEKITPVKIIGIVLVLAILLHVVGFLK